MSQIKEIEKQYLLLKNKENLTEEEYYQMLNLENDLQEDNMVNCLTANQENIKCAASYKPPYSK